MKKIILVLVGMPGSGKSTIIDFITKKYNAKVFSSGDVIREERRRKGLENTPENDKKIAIWFSKGREDIVVKRIWEKIKKCKNKIIVVDGFRGKGNTERLNKISGIKPIIIAVDVPFKIRAKRMLKRKRFKGKENIKYLKERDKAEIKIGVVGLMKKADYRIDNSGTKPQTHKKTNEMMSKMLKQKH